MQRENVRRDTEGKYKERYSGKIQGEIQRENIRRDTEGKYKERYGETG